MCIPVCVHCTYISIIIVHVLILLLYLCTCTCICIHIFIFIIIIFHLAAPSIERIDSSLFQYYNAPDFASTPAGPITDWASKLDKKKQQIQENCRQLDLVRECTCTVEHLTFGASKLVLLIEVSLDL